MDLRMEQRLFVVLIMLTLLACTTVKTDDEQLESRIERQPVSETSEQTLQRADEVFSSSEDLTEEQKQRIMQIYERVYAQSKDVSNKLSQNKSLLFVELSKENYKASTVTKIKKNIKALDKERLKIFFKGLDEVRTIVGRGVGSETVYRYLDNEEAIGLQKFRR